MKTTKWVLLSLIAVLMAGVAYGACTFGNPLDSGTLRGSESINVSCAAEDDAYNCTVTATSATSGSSVATINLFNTSDSQINATWDSKGVVDAGDYVWAGTCLNFTGESYTITSVTGVTIDNTKPALTLSTPAANSLDTDGIVTFNYACVNATAATLYIESNAYTMTESADVCTYTNPSSSKLTNGFHSWYIIASDGLNSTTSATTKVEVRKPGGPVIDESGSVQTGTVSTSKGGLAGNSTLAFVVFAGIIWYVASSKKKKGR